MANFYNPYMKTPDFAGGAQDIMNQVMMMRLMQQLMGQNQQPQIPQPQGQPGIGAGAGMPPQTPGMGQQIPPQVLMMLMQLMQRR